jgi:hypothetical protein
MTGKQLIIMPPLRPFEVPDEPATVLAIPPERQKYAVTGEHPTADELQSMPRAIIMQPLRPDEIPESSGRVLAATPDRVLDEPGWGTAKQAPLITAGRGKLLHPWDD